MTKASLSQILAWQEKVARNATFAPNFRRCLNIMNIIKN